MKFPIKKIRKTFKKKSAKIILTSIVFLAAILVFYFKFGKVEGSATSPEVTIADLAGKSSSDFRKDEQANLNLKTFAENTQTKQADVILALDTSNSMAGNKFTFAKNALKGFIDRIDETKQTKIGFVTYNQTATLVTQLTLMNSDAAKTALKTQVDGVGLGPYTCMGCAAQLANTELTSVRSRPNGSKYLVLFTDGEEGAAPFITTYLNGSVFTSSQAGDPSTLVNPGSQLATSINDKIRYFTIFYGGANLTCYGTNTPGYSIGCSLLRFAAAKTNNANLPSGFTWKDDFNSQISGVSNLIDGVYHFKIFDPNELNKVFLATLSAIEGAPASLEITERLAPQASYLATNSVIDKGGRTYPYTVTSKQVDGSTELTYNITGVPERYYCASSETQCIANGKIDSSGNYFIENNFINLNLKVEFNNLGVFDLNSNYTGCGSNNVTKTADNSKIDYLSSSNSDPTSNGTVYKSFTFSSLCINVTSGGTGNKILKTTYDESGNKKASFEAGDIVKVILEIDESDSQRSDYVIEDFIPASVTGAINYKFSRQNDGFSKDGISTTAADGKIEFSGSDELKLLQGKNFIEYSYRI